MPDKVYLKLIYRAIIMGEKLNLENPVSLCKKLQWLKLYDRRPEYTQPNQFVLKCTHDSGGLIICHDKTKLNIPDVKVRLEKCLKRNYYNMGRE